MQDSQTKSLIDKYMKCFFLSIDELHKIVRMLGEAFDRGLNGDLHSFHYSPLKMLPTHLSVVPDGTERGKFVAIDLGGTNLRFLQIYVVEGKLVPISMAYEVPKTCMTGTGKELFAFIANCIKVSLNKAGLLDKEIQHLGYTFSFPVNQLALNSGLLIRWTKGYSASGVEGRDVVELLREACDEEGLLIKDYVLINDTTGTLLCGAFEDKHAKIGVIVGTGTNACYLEDLSKVKTWTIPTYHKKIIINTEWGAFGENGELAGILTQVDILVDMSSINTGKQIFEKMISGMYLGEIARQAVLEFHRVHTIFKNGMPVKLLEQYSLPSSLLSDSCVEETFKTNFLLTYEYCLQPEEQNILAYIFDIVTQRSANLCAAGLAALLKRIECPRGVIAADGSLIRKHPRYVSYVQLALKLIVPERDFEIKLVDDGSGKGAALAACVATIAAN